LQFLQTPGRTDVAGPGTIIWIARTYHFVFSCFPTLFFLFVYCCAVEFHCGIYKVLTMYQIYHTWIHTLHHSPLLSSLPDSWNSLARVYTSLCFFKSSNAYVRFISQKNNQKQYLPIDYMRLGCRRMNILQILCTHICKWENDTCWNCLGRLILEFYSQNFL
jgi:hypothetical protein